MSGTTLKLGVENQFDSYGRPKSTVYDFGGFTQKNTVNYVANSDLISSFYFQMQSTYNPYVSYTYDKLERLTNETFVEDDYEILKKAYTYYDGVDSTKTTNFIRTETFNGSSRHYLYEYDDLGNISRVIYNIQHDIKYTYDSLNQLVREDNTYANRSYTYEYDKAGNILYKRTYTYTMGTLGTPLSTDNYGYNNPAWGDLLTSYNGKTINYDAIGNPTNWRGYIDTLYWEGRRLSGIDVGSYYNSYYYNESGIRTRKSIWEDVSSELIDVSYIVDGSKILKETRTSNYYSTDTLYYYYDASGSVIGFSYNGTSYYYGKNIQGDVRFIYDLNGNRVVQYNYDAWGNLLSMSGSHASTLGEANPFRYRSYYYDTETGLFYVGSRYYDPEIGRFINADGIIGANQDIMGHNLFAYCSNNPVNYSDPTGCFKIPNIFKIAIKTSLKMLKTALLGNGTSQYYGPKSVVSKTLSKSAIMKEEVNKNVQTAKDSGAKSTTVTGSVSLYGKDNKYDFDLSYSVGKANYSMEIVQETKTTGIWFWKKEKVRYITTVTVMDTYNFDEYREDGSFGSMLNNWGYDMQNEGNLMPFYWEATYIVKGKWVKK